MSSLKVAALSMLICAGNGWTQECSLHPAKRTIAISWLGINNQSGFDESMKSLDTYFSKSQAGGIHFRGHELDKSLDVSSLTAQDTSHTTIAFTAQKAEFEQIPPLIQKDFDRFRANPNNAAEDYEIVVMVSNHGGITAGPNVDYGLPSPVPGQSVLTESLRKFSLALPKGVRLKIVAGACYGSDIDQALSQRGGCTCSVAAAAPGMSAASNSRGGFEGLFFDNPSGSSLFERSWLAQGRGTPQGLDVLPNGDIAENDYLSSADLLLLNELRRRDAENSKTSSIQDYESQSLQIASNIPSTSDISPPADSPFTNLDLSNMTQTRIKTLKAMSHAKDDSAALTQAEAALKMKFVSDNEILKRDNALVASYNKLVEEFNSLRSVTSATAVSRRNAILVELSAQTIELNYLRAQRYSLPAVARLYARGLLEKAVLKKNFDDLKSTDPAVSERARAWLDQYARARRCEHQSMGEEAKIADEKTAQTKPNSAPDFKHTAPIDPRPGN